MINKEDTEQHKDYFNSPNPLVRYAHNARRKKVIEMIGGNSRILEVGCGDGEVLKMVPDGELYGIEHLQLRVHRARQNVKEGMILKADAGALPFEDGFFDTVFATELFNYLEHPGLAAEEMLRVTKKGGKIIISVPHPLNWRLGRLIVGHLPLKLPDSVNDFYPEDIDKLFMREPIESATIPPVPYPLCLTYISKYIK